MSKRIKDLKSPATRWWEQAYVVVAKPFSVLSDEHKFWLGFAVLCLLTTLLIQNPLWRATGDTVYQEGDIARENITAPADI